MPLLSLTLSAFALGACLYLVRRAKPLDDAAARLPEGDEPYLTRQVRRTLHPEAHGDFDPFNRSREGN